MGMLDGILLAAYRKAGAVDVCACSEQRPAVGKVHIAEQDFTKIEFRFREGGIEAERFLKSRARFVAAILSCECKTEPAPRHCIVRRKCQRLAERGFTLGSAAEMNLRDTEIAHGGRIMGREPHRRFV